MAMIDIPPRAPSSDGLGDYYNDLHQAYMELKKKLYEESVPKTGSVFEKMPLTQEGLEYNAGLPQRAAFGAFEQLAGGEPGSVQQGMNWMSSFPMMPIAYHGSPYKFDKFDKSYIGTGEGTKKVGHGLYFTGSKEEGILYAESLAADSINPNIEPQAYLYKVKIKPSVKKFIDWGLPLSEQPDVAQKLIDRFGAGVTVKDGKTFYKELSGRLGSDKVASEYLNDIGIPGIRYLQYRNQGSRGAGKDIYNYVVFNDKDVKILERK